ncbi:hypothetical protein LshimejAT787_0300830 [Lyophyllum shimeji]|uniref:Copper transporter n=1 Tax=Lyophyllum shimeji TaxID=47721 RepID=A0A9P3PH04_LYOSH|nr:hypothetical protein LshimejAT787_0300830 [Lyophyllum shimeji]
MDNWEPYLHWAFRDEAVLVPSLYLHSFSSFLAASILTTCICACERCLSHLLDKHWSIPFIRHSRWKKLVWRASLYWIVTFLRLCYMLISMTFNLGLILVLVTALTVTQTVLELLNSSECRQNPRRDIGATDLEQPLLERQSELSLVTRPRLKSRPGHIYIDPSHSNIARADALASELGISPNPERVQLSQCERTGASFDAGAARAMSKSSQSAAGPDSHLPTQLEADPVSD